MFPLFLIFLNMRLASCKFNLTQTIWPDNTVDELSYYGNSVAISEDFVVVGAEYFHIPGVVQHNSNRTGVVYVYKYNTTTAEYELTDGNTPSLRRLQPNVDDPDFKVGTFGSDIRIAKDPARILVGAPYTDVRKTRMKDVPVFNESLQKEFKESDITEEDGKFWREIGTMHIYTYDEAKKLWNEVAISIPNEIMYLGGYGRVLASSRGLNKFAGAYYNKLRRGMGIPPTLGIVFVSYFDDDGSVKMYPPIEPFKELTEYEYQRFGAQLKFVGQDQLLIVVLDQKSTYAGTYLYQLITDDKKNSKWEKMKKIEFKNSEQYTTYATSIDVRIDPDLNNLIVMSAQNKDKTYEIVFVSADSTADKEPQQIIKTGTDSPSYFEFCGQFLAVTFKDDIKIYEMNESKQYVLIQTIEDPKILGSGQENMDYETFGVTFPGQFAWEPTLCKKFIVGANSGKNGGLDRESKPYGRAYVYETDVSDGEGGKDKPDQDNKKDNKVAIIAGCTVAAVVVVIIIIVVIVVVIRKRKKNNLSDSNEV